MAAASDNGSSATELLNPSSEKPHSSIQTPMNDHDSTEQSPQLAPQEATETKPSDTQSTDDINSSGKRKREDDQEEAPNYEEPKPSLHPLWKTSLCSYFRSKSGSCSHGNACRYAHGEEELRPRPDSSWDPSSERAKKLMKSERGEKALVLESREDDLLITEAPIDDDCFDPALSKCLVNLPMKWSSDNLRNFLSEQGVMFKSAKKKKGMAVGFVSFESAEQLKSALEELDGRSVGNKNLKVADVITRSFEKKTKSAMPLPQSTQQSMKPALAGADTEVSVSSNVFEDGDRVDNSPALDDSVSRAKSARDVVTPLAHMPYADQLELKKNSIMQTLKRLTRNARKACPNGVALPEWILKSREIGGLPCKLEGILESPLVNGYRNKCEFSVGISLQGKPTAGFTLGNFREGVTAIEEPVDCPNVSTITYKYASIFQEFLQHSSLPVWNRFNNTGFWRQLTVREGRKPGKVTDVEHDEANISEVMLMVQVCTVGVDDELLNSELERMVQAFTAGATANSPPLPVTALVVQDHKGISNVAPADAPLRQLPIPEAKSDSGQDAANNIVEPRIHDYISNLRFCISPTAFFQVNTLAAEKLYSLAGDWAGLGPDTLVFDICCGTGTIGLTLAHRVGMVVGIEMNASAVSDAHRNAEINGIKNCRFVCAKAENVMGSLLKEYLNVPQKQDEIPNASESNDEEITITTEKDTSMDNVPDPEESTSENNDEEITITTEKDSSMDNVPDPEESTNHQLENGKGASGCSENSRQEPENQLQKSCTSEGGNTSIQQFKNVVAIVDPPRGGLHPIVIKALRTHPRLRRLVYISCNPESLVANAIELCTPSADKTEKGNKNNRRWRNISSAGLARHRTKSMPNSEPFRPVKAMAVDLFPHTPHCEMVMLLER